MPAIARHRKTLWAGLIILALMLLIPPWQYTFHMSGSRPVERSAGYYPVFAPPPPLKEGPRYGVRIDFARLVLQCGVVVVILGGPLFMRRR